MKANPIPQLPSTVNLHFIRPCNGHCNYCFAGFEDLECSRLKTAELLEIIQKIAAVPLPDGIQGQQRKINFVGGEPTLAPDLPLLVRAAKEAGLTTSIVTNGYRLVQSGLGDYAGCLDLLGVSIDSLDPATNRRIGRVFQNSVICEDEWIRLFSEARQQGIGLKINTVVNRQNVDDDMGGFIRKVAPLRWKIFQAPADNAAFRRDWNAIQISFHEFRDYVDRHLDVVLDGVELVAESNDLMRGSYAMVSPDGRFFDTASGIHRYSAPLLRVGVEQAFSQIRFSDEKFARRGGNYFPKINKIGKQEEPAL